ncbi:MAG: arabinofuranosyltransferase, partial [Actinobacteria bacterium]|nr:arabinofuranosyltransferase [Actinomycetota bacterium]
MADSTGGASALDGAPDGATAQPAAPAVPGDPVAAQTSPPRPVRPGRRPAAAARWLANPSLAALLVWLASLPVAVIAVRLLRPGDPFALRPALVPLAAAGAGVVILAVLAWRLRAELASGIAAGLFAGWIAFTLRLALHGTPFGFGGLGHDAGRLAAMANRYAYTWRSTDGIVPSVPSHYPPLFPWLVGRTAALIHAPAWQLLGPAEIITLSGAVVAGFALWRRLVPGPVALAVTLPVLLAFGLPEKAYEVLVLVVVAPWALAAFARPPKGRLHWLPAGLIGGLIIAAYWAYLAYAALGIAALIVLTWRASPERGRYLRQVALIIAVAVVVSSWYVVPYAAWAIMHGVQEMDMYHGGGISASPLPFLAVTPLAVLELTGLAGLIWYRGRAWWATPLLLLTASTYAYWLLYLVIFITRGHTGSLQDTRRLIEPLLAMSGVLTLVEAAPGVIRRLAAARIARPGLPAAALGVLIAWTAVGLWQAWIPGAAASASHHPLYTTPVERIGAFTYAMPDGRYPRFSPRSGRPGFPLGAIRAAVRSVDGPDAVPVTLSDSEQIFAFMRWPGYIGVSDTSAGATTQWRSRYAALAQLSRVTSPAEFAGRSAHTPFGAIDVFILHRGRTRWTWPPHGSLPVKA